LTINAGESDANPYRFVRGSPLRLVDPIGLCDAETTSCPPPDSCILIICSGGNSGGGGSGGGSGGGGAVGAPPPPTYGPPPAPPPPPNPGVPVTAVDLDAPTPFQLSVERMPGFYEEGDWQSKFYTYTEGYQWTVPMGAATALVGVAGVIPRVVWLASALG